MKRILILISLFIGWQNGTGQSRPIELADLVRSLLPDSASSGPIVKWNSPSIQSKPVNWQSTTPIINEKIYALRGSIPLAINGETFSCELGQNRPCPFQVYLQGNEEGYSTISLDHLSGPSFQPKQQISFLFSQLVRSKIIRKNLDTGNVRVYTYEFRMPGKKLAWLKYATMTSEMGNSIYLKIYFTEKELKLEEQVKP